MTKVRLRKNSNPYNILKILSLSAGFLVISTLSPLGGAAIIKSLIRGYLRQKNFEKYRFLNDLKNLQRRELINYKELPTGEIKITLTKMGKEKILQYKLDEIKINKSKKWDGKWRLIMFDIPHRQKAARDALRAKLKQLEFYPVQKSVFITPYPCENEIDFISSVLNIRNHVLIFYSNHFEGAEKFKHYFKI